MANPIITTIKGMNVFGMGSEPVAIAIAAAVALFLTQKSIKEREYNDTALVFGINWVLMISAGLAGNVAILGIYWLVVMFTMYFSRKEAQKVAHTVVK